MTVKQYKQTKLILMIGLVALVGISIITTRIFISFFALLGYLFIVSLLKTRVKGVLADERQVQVSEKAAQVSFQILLPMLMLTSVALMLGGGSTDFYYVRALGIILSYVTCIGLIIYLLAYWYFNQKSGG